MIAWTKVSARTSLVAAILGFGVALALHLASFFVLNEILPLSMLIIYIILFSLSAVAGASASWRWWSSQAPPLPEPVAPVIAWVRAHLAYGYLLVILLWCLAPLWVYITYWSGLEQPPVSQVAMIRIITALFMGMYVIFFLDVIKRGQRKTAQN